MTPIRTALAILASTVALASFTGCAVTRGQESVGAFVDDTAITTAVKARFLNDGSVDGTSISVATLNGTVMLSGFARSTLERDTAMRIARDVNGVKSVNNAIALRP